ncbi:3'5'-cyclic nucleotide phosphodiesterase domain-containing protein [Ditylenchus destructor]|nr:3'5'-cyclic nucleotide phosphodiesterase domain-containing protein [Ditylenchus destructor]
MFIVENRPSRPPPIMRSSTPPVKASNTTNSKSNASPGSPIFYPLSSPASISGHPNLTAGSCLAPPPAEKMRRKSHTKSQSECSGFELNVDSLVSQTVKPEICLSPAASPRWFSPRNSDGNPEGPGSVVGNASLFDKNVMLLSAMTRSRDTTPHICCNRQRAATSPSDSAKPLQSESILRKKSDEPQLRKHDCCDSTCEPSRAQDTYQHHSKHSHSEPQSCCHPSTSSSLCLSPSIHINGENHWDPHSDSVEKSQEEQEGETVEPPRDCISPAVCKKLLSLSEDMNLLVRNITKEAKALVQAEICSLFLLDKEHSELVAEVFEKNGTSDEYLTEIRMPLTQGIVGHVATTGQMMNVKDVYNHPYFYPKVDERTGFVTRNILCFPIKDSQGNLVGVAELCNKIGKSSFTKHDEQIATTFAVYCAISISHCLLYRKLQEAHRRSHMAAELLVQGSTLSIAPEDILRLTVRDIPAPTSFHPEFNGFHFVPRSIGTGDTYVEASLSMFKDLGFIDRYRLRRRTLARFLLMVQKGYRDVPYHNWSHAFAVGHFCYLLVRMPAVKQALSELERFALLVACLCHDIDHRGTTNAFQLQSKTPLAQLYSSEGSVLERHHFAQTVTILGMDECNIFEQLTRQQYQIVLDSIREIILATDIAAHLRKVQRIKQMVDDGYDAAMPDHHYLFMCLLMTASDLSDQSKDFRNSKAIAENIYKEFFSQGDLEKQMGNRPIEMMDRERACVPKIQLEFMDTVALPVFDYLSQMLPDLSSTYESIVTNRCCWSTLDDILQEEGLASQGLGLEYLRNSELERRVLERIRQERPPQFGRNQLQSPSEKGPFGETSSSPGSPVTQPSGIFSTAENAESHEGDDSGSPTSSPSKRPKPPPEHTIHEKSAQ